MSEHIAKTETDEATGVTLKIILDEMGGTDSPMENDPGAFMVILHRRYINPAMEKHNAALDGFDFSTPEGVAEFEKYARSKAGRKEWVTFPLFLYDHSGTAYRCSEGGNPFSCPWDSGRVGIIALNKKEVGKPGKKYGNGKACPSYFKQAESLCEYYTAWANGEVYGYVVENEDGDELDACWGFIEPDGADGYVYEEGKAAMKRGIENALEARAFEIGKTAAMSREFGMEPLT